MDWKNEYEGWVGKFASDGEIIDELRIISGDDDAIKDRFYTDLRFGTAGMRGILGAGTNRMNKYVVRRATKGLCDYLNAQGGAPSVAIGYDSRRKSREFALETALVCCACGVKAYLFDALRPVALLSFAVRRLGASAGVVVTASHNPPEYNGYKVYWSDGAQTPPERADDIYALIRRTEYDSVKIADEKTALEDGTLVYIGAEIDEQYYDMVLKLMIQPELCMERGHELSVVYTPLNGSGYVPVTEALKRAGFSNVSTVHQQRDPDPDFTTVGVPNPENKAAFKLALDMANEISADLVFATDPDCDRVGVAARLESGDYALLSGNQIGCLLSHYIYEGLRACGRLPQNGAAVKSIVSTPLADEIAGAYGVKMFDVLTGFKFIAEKIEEFESSGEYKYLFGFEESYGYLSGTDVRDKDGVNASLLLAEAALWHKLNGRTLDEAMTALYNQFGWGLEGVKNISLTGMDGQAKMAAAMSLLRENAPEALAGRSVIAVRDYLSGLRNRRSMGLPPTDALYFELTGSAWVCIRPSGTEPKIKLYAGVLENSRETALSMLEELLQSSGDMLKNALGE